ncbi:MAG: DoxX family protein [Bacteroidota bacterium]
MNESLGKLLLRLGYGGLMITHGWPKLSKLIETGKFEFGDPIGVGPTLSLLLTIFAEFLCSILVVIGFKTRIAAIFPAITMVVAAFIVHGDDPFRRKEMAILYLIGFVAIALVGPGDYSLDKRGRKPF